MEGIGGVFFRAEDPEALGEWYADNLGVVDPPGGVWRQEERPTVFVPFSKGTDHSVDRAQLVFHRGSRVRADAGDFAFDDDTGLLRWVAEDRAVVALPDAEARERDVVTIVNRWVTT
ncbi:hypothetical protein [Rubrobacter radiotolerans]|uniref:hypothetical protein n=1 Tax=Rubrobacter radiotolerans TaxID=42256 RepID=UPI003B5B9A0E